MRGELGGGGGEFCGGTECFNITICFRRRRAKELSNFKNKPNMKAKLSSCVADATKGVNTHTAASVYTQ